MLSILLKYCDQNLISPILSYDPQLIIVSLLSLSVVPKPAILSYLVLALANCLPPIQF